MHQQPAARVDLRLAAGLAAVGAGREADRRRALSFEREFGRVLEDQHRTVMRDEPITRRLEVAGQDLGLADAIVGQEPIGALGRRPVLAGHRQALADRPAHALEQHAKPLAEPLVRELASREFVVQP